MASGYDFVLTAEVFRFSETCRLAERQSLGDIFRFLTDHPFLNGDYQETGRDGAPVEVLLKGQFLLAFRTDHAVKEIRILRVQRI